MYYTIEGGGVVMIELLYGISMLIFVVSFLITFVSMQTIRRKKEEREQHVKKTALKNRI
jgi:uncharacterized membrane protein